MTQKQEKSLWFSSVFVKPISNTSVSIIKDSFINKYIHSQVNFTHQRHSLPERHLAQNVEQEQESGARRCFFLHIQLHLRFPYVPNIIYVIQE